MGKILEKPEPGTIWTPHDEDCPKCGFPETITIRDEKTMKPLAFKCSKRKGCDFYRKLK
jgi:hypothetical protein